MLPMSDKRRIEVFPASPGGIAVERRAFKRQIDLLNAGFGDGANVAFIPLGGDDPPPLPGPRPEIGGSSWQQV